MGTVFKKEGKYLRYSEHTTHTGAHRNAGWVDDLQQATVFHTMPPLRLRQDEQLQDAERLEATETRTVTLTHNASLSGLPLEASVGSHDTTQPRLTVRLTSFPESNGKRNWTALLMRVEEWDGLIGNCGGIAIDQGEYWNRVAYEAERAKLLIGERDTEPNILDYGDDIRTPEEWAGEIQGGCGQGFGDILTRLRKGGL